jgi:hypothetical protein
MGYAGGDPARRWLHKVSGESRQAELNGGRTEAPGRESEDASEELALLQPKKDYDEQKEQAVDQLARIESTFRRNGPARPMAIMKPDATYTRVAASP